MAGKVVYCEDYHEFDYIAKVMGYKTSEELGFCQNSPRPYVGVVGKLSKKELLKQLSKHKKCPMDWEDEYYCDIRTEYFPETLPKKWLAAQAAYEQERVNA